MRSFVAGDKVLHLSSKRIGEVSYINTDMEYPVRVKFSEDIVGFMYDGRYNEEETKPAIYHVLAVDEIESDDEPTWIDFALLGIGFAGGFVAHFLIGVTP